MMDGGRARYKACCSSSWDGGCVSRRRRQLTYLANSRAPGNGWRTGQESSKGNIPATMQDSRARRNAWNVVARREWHETGR